MSDTLDETGHILQTTWGAMWRRPVLLSSAAGTLGAKAAFLALGTDAGFWMLPLSSMPVVVVVLGARGWLALIASASALSAMRHRFRWRPTAWVSPMVAFQVGFVSLCLILPILACMLLLILPGVLLALRWSQAAMTILDGRASWFDATRRSEELTSGRWPLVGFVWILAGVILALVAWLGGTFGEIAAAFELPVTAARSVTWAVATLADLFTVTLLAALYHELTVDQD